MEFNKMLLIRKLQSWQLFKQLLVLLYAHFVLNNKTHLNKACDILLYVDRINTNIDFL